MKYIVGDRTHFSTSAEVQRSLTEAHTIVSLDHDGDGPTAFVFDKGDDLAAWARSAPAPVEQTIAEVDELARKARELETTDTARAMRWQSRMNRRIVAEMQALAEESGLDLASPELFRLAHDGGSVLEPPVLHSALLWDGIACSGGVCPVPSATPLPLLSWLGFNNRASSASGLGGVTLFENNWFGGRSAFVFSMGTCTRLSDLTFDNIASSAIGF